MRPRVSVRGCVRLMVGLSIGRSVGPSVCNTFVKIAEKGIMQDGDASYRVYGLVWELSGPEFRGYLQGVSQIVFLISNLRFQSYLEF